MTEQNTNLPKLFANCWKDEALKARFMSDPKAVLAEYGMSVPEGMNVKVVENSDSHVHLTLPAPPADDNDLSDDELSDAAGGSITFNGDIGPLAASEDLSDAELGKAAGGNVAIMDYAGCSVRVVNSTVKMSVPDGTPIG